MNQQTRQGGIFKAPPPPPPAVLHILHVTKIQNLLLLFQRLTRTHNNTYTYTQTGVRDLWADLLGANIHVQKPLTGQFWKYMLVLRVKICLY